MKKLNPSRAPQTPHPERSRGALDLPALPHGPSTTLGMSVLGTVFHLNTNCSEAA